MILDPDEFELTLIMFSDQVGANKAPSTYIIEIVNHDNGDGIIRTSEGYYEHYSEGDL